MNIFKITTLGLLLAFSFCATSVIAYAEEAVTSSVVSPNEAILHLEKAKVEISKSDFNAAQVHLKAARAASEKVTGNPDIVKKATAGIIQAQIKSKLGDIKAATEEVNKVMELYKSI